MSYYQEDIRLDFCSESESLWLVMVARFVEMFLISCWFSHMRCLLGFCRPKNNEINKSSISRPIIIMWQWDMWSVRLYRLHH